MKYVFKGMVVNSQPLFMPGGSISNWAYEVNSEMYFNTQREAPLNKRQNKSAGQPPVGTLLAEVFSDVTRTTPKTFTIETGSRAPYTVYVVKGTNTIIARNRLGQFAGTEDREAAMYLPANPGYGPARWRQRVRGQAANDFITRGYNATALRHPALKRRAV